MMITQSQLKKEVYYDKETGYFFRINPRKGVTDHPCGSVNKFGYVSVSVKGSNYSAHKLSILYCHGFMPKKVVDHIDGNRVNNRIDNLKACSHSVNSRNARLRKDNKTGVSGAYKVGYRYALVIGGKSLGTFKELKDLKVAADKYRSKNGYGAGHGEKRSIGIESMVSSYKQTVKNYKEGVILPPINLIKIRELKVGV